MFERRRVVAMVALAVIAPVVARAQGATKPYRIGFLTVEADDRLRLGLRELGYVEGRDVVYEIRNAEGRTHLFDDFALDLVQRKVDVIVAPFPAAVLSAKKATATIPIVMINTPDPVQLGLVANLAKPGGNITGLTTLTVEVCVKQFELLKEVVPRASRIALLWNPDNPWHARAVKAVQSRARSLGVQIHALEVRGPEAIDGAFNAMTAQRAEAVLMLADPMLFVHRRRLAELANQRRLPSMTNAGGFGEDGNLLSYWPERTDLYRRAASYVDRILKGAKPGDLPIEQPTKYEFIVNLKTARAIGISIPQAVLVRADRLIE